VGFSFLPLRNRARYYLDHDHPLHHDLSTHGLLCRACVLLSLMMTC
jgi:hypothetical protein